MLDMRQEFVCAIAAEQAVNTALANDSAADLCLDILLNDLITDVGKNQIPDVPAQNAGRVDLDGRNAERLLPYLASLGVVATGDGTADIRLMALTRSPGNQCVLLEDRLEYGDVGVLVAA